MRRAASSSRAPTGVTACRSATASGQATLSIAVPGSVIDNCQTREQATAVAGLIARTAAIFNTDEVIVIDDSGARSGTVSMTALIHSMQLPPFDALPSLFCFVLCTRYICNNARHSFENRA